MKLDWQELLDNMRDRPLTAALTGSTVFFTLAGLMALVAGSHELALGAAFVMMLFYFLTLMSMAEA